MIHHLGEIHTEIPSWGWESEVNIKFSKCFSVSEYNRHRAQVFGGRRVCIFSVRVRTRHGNARKCEKPPYDPVVKWSKTLPFHGSNTGSNPVRVTICAGVTQLVEWLIFNQ